MRFEKSYYEENNSYMHCVADGFYANVYQNGYIEVGKDFCNGCGQALDWNVL